MSVTDILRKIGNPMETSELTKKVAKEMNMSDRQAYRKIAKAWKDKEIKKFTLPDRTVLCSLPEWPVSTSDSRDQRGTLTFQDAFKYRCFKKLDEISRLSEGNPILALNRLSRLVSTLPPQQKEKLSPRIQQSYDHLAKAKGVDYYTTLIARQKRAHAIVEVLIDRISTVLHES